MSAPRISYRCAACGSSEVVRNADVTWNDELQWWEVNNLFDHADCDACGGECRLEEVKIGQAALAL